MPRILYRPALLLSTLLGVVLFAGGCDSLTELDSVTVTGRVIDQNGTPIEGAKAKIAADQFVRQVDTDSAGVYTFTFELSEALGPQQNQAQEQTVATVSLSAFVGAAVSETISEQVTSGESYSVPDLQITVANSGGAPVPTGEQAVVTGRIVNQGGAPVEGATAQIKTANMIRQATTAADGTYSFAFTAVEAVGEGSTATLIAIELSAFLGADVSETVTQEAQVGAATTLPDLALPISSGGATAVPASITLTPESIQEVTVSGSGGAEIAQLGFIVFDADGLPVPGVTVEATIDARPVNASGNADNSFLAPNSTENGRMATNVTGADGIAPFTFTSGTVAGTAQIVAQVPGATNPAGSPIRTQPVALLIQSGLPNERHFSVAVERPNEPCLNEVACELPVVIVAGDEYSNPVREGTPIFLEADYGVVESQTLTDDLGKAGGTFVTGNPFPPDGIVRLTARASGTRSGSGGTQEEISTSTQFLLTGNTRITVLGGPFFEDDFIRSGDTVNVSSAFDGIPDGKIDTVAVRARYNYRVADSNDNPLTLGTSIAVTAEGENVEAFGQVEISIDDYISQPGPNGFTDFTFVAKMDDRDGDLAFLESFSIAVGSPNGTGDLVRETFLPLFRLEDR
ncbi:MAG: hypothetical protein AAF809_02170 [Bacteroidota bacterium]